MTWISTAGAVAGALLAVAGLLALIGRGVRRMASTLQRIREFLDDWQGEPARAGVPERPGVMERLARLEVQTGMVVREVRPNGGSSLRDQVARIERATGAAEEE